MAATAVIVMGVSGSGKSTVARLLADELGWVFAEGDDFHSPANIARMRAGQALGDAERAPWLAAIAAWLRGQCGGAVVSCSALRRSYRDALRDRGGQVGFVLLGVGRETLAGRLAHRPGHFMPAALLDSQLATLEPLGPDENGVRVDASGTPEQAVAAVRAWLQQAAGAAG